MAKTFTPPDTEFATATGGNVNDRPGISSIDHPPWSCADLVIAPNGRDTDPRLFAVGETCRLSFAGPGGPRVLEDAVILRSDDLAAGQGAVVFEGNDQHGDVVQVVWSPGFDLHAWYRNHFEPGARPGFYTTDRRPGDFRHVCFASGTLIATPQGAVPVERLQPGQRVSTRDDGAVPVLWAGRKTMPGLGAAAPVVFAPGTLDNTRPLVLSQQHRVLMATPRVALAFGVPEVLAPAKALIDGRSVWLAPRREITYCHLLLPMHAILDAEGAGCESLFLGDVAQRALGAEEVAEIASFFPELAAAAGPGRLLAARPMLRAGEARLLRAEQARVGHGGPPAVLPAA